MTLETALERLLTAYERYYDINREDPMPPFAAEAVFRLHDEEYFLIKSAKVAEQDSYEYVFFATVPELDEAKAAEWADLVWKECLQRTDPKPNPRNTDAHLIILCEKMTEGARKTIAGTNPYKSYRLGLRGWSTLKLIAYETSEGSIVHNRRGESLKKLISNI